MPATQPTIPTPAQSFAWADRLRNLATILVVVLHVSAPIAEEYTLYDTWYWWSGNLWDSLARPAVPLFVMLSGYLLLGKDYELGPFLRKRLVRVVVPALFWMLIYCYYNYRAHNDPATLPAAFKRIVHGPVHYHLWFIYLIIGLYLTYPILRPWVRSATERDFRYFFAICILGTWIYKTMSTFLDLRLGLYIELFTNQTGFFVLGYYLGTKPLSGAPATAVGPSPWPFSSRRLLWLALGLLLAGTVATALGTYFSSITIGGGKFHPFFYDYLTPNVSIAAMGWFLLVRWFFNNDRLRPVERDFAAASFGIYFIHVLVMDWLAQAGYWQSKMHPGICIPVLIVLVLGFCFMFVSILRVLPGGTKIT